MRHRSCHWLPITVVLLLSASASSRAQAPAATIDPYPSPITLLDHEVEYTVASDGTFVREEFARILINVDQAVPQQAQTYLQHSESLQRLEVIEAYTETAAGERIDVEPTQIFTQQSPVSTNAPAFGDVKITAIVFPQMSVGAVKTVRYRLEQKVPLFAGEFSMLESLPAIVDVERSRITLTAPARLDMQVEAIGVDGGEVRADRRRTRKWVWTLENQRAVMPESDSVDPIDFSPRIAATTFTGVDAAAAAYLAGAADKAEVTDAVRARADAITAGLGDPLAQARAIHAWVAGQIRYVALQFGLGGVVPRHVDAILASGYGDCKDKVVLLTALLNAKGIAAHAVLVNAQNAYWQPGVPIVPGVYNHAIAYLPDFDVFVDPTSATTPFGLLPIVELGKSALVTGGLDGGAALRILPAPHADEAVLEVETAVAIDADGHARGESHIAGRGAVDVILRGALAGVPPGQESRAAAQLMATTGQLGGADLRAGDARALDERFAIDTTFSIDGAMTLPGPGALIVPVGVPSPTPIFQLARQVDLPQRRLPMVCGAYTKVERTVITLPDGIEATRLPAVVRVENALGTYTADYRQEAGAVHVERRLRVNAPAVLCTPDDYALIRELGQAVGRDMRAQVLY